MLKLSPQADIIKKRHSEKSTPARFELRTMTTLLVFTEINFDLNKGKYRAGKLTCGKGPPFIYRVISGLDLQLLAFDILRHRAVSR